MWEEEALARAGKAGAIGGRGGRGAGEGVALGVEEMGCDGADYEFGDFGVAAG